MKVITEENGYKAENKAPCSPISGAAIGRLTTQAIHFLWLELTDRCNLRCLHCYADALPDNSLTGKMTLTDWQGALDRAAAGGCKMVQFIGGEPTLHPHFSELLQYAHACGYSMIEVFSNATMLTHSVLATFRGTGARLATSLYGPDDSFHDAVTSVRGSFNRTLNAIRDALKIGIPVRVGIIANELSEKEIASTVTLAREVGVEQITVHRTHAVGRAAVNFPLAKTDGCGQCGKGTVCVTATGKVLPCVFSRSQQLGTVWNWSWRTPQA